MMATNQSASTNSCNLYEVGPVILAIALSLLIVVSIAGNLLTIAAFLKDRSLRSKPTNLFILSLSCADLIIGFTIPLKVGHALCRHWPYGETACQLEVFLNDVGVVSGMWCMAAIALDRYLLISRDYARYLDLQSHRNVVRTIAVVFSMSVGVAVCEITIWVSVDWTEHNVSYDFDTHCLSPPRKNVIYASTVFFTVLFLPILIMVVLTLSFLVLLRRRLQKFKKQSNVITHRGAKSSKETGHSKASPSRRLENNKRKITGSEELEDSTSAEANGVGGRTPSNLRDGDTSTQTNFNTQTPVVHTPINMEQADMRANEQPPSNQYHPPGRHTSVMPDIMKDRYIRPAIILGALITTFLLCSLPYIIFISAIVRINQTYFDDLVHFHLFNVLFLNSCIGPIIYARTHPKIHQFHSNLFASIKNKILCKD